MKCCICGTVKNCANYLDKIFATMEVIGTLFQQYKIVLYYDHSNDATLQKLKHYKSVNPLHFEYYINNEPLSLYRTHNIAKGRNKCLDVIRDKYSDYEYFIMMDCDDVCSGIFNSAVFRKYLLRNDWDALSFNHPNGYYDIWALSKDPCFLGYNHFYNGANIYMNYINAIIKKTPKHELIACFSAFNGFAIYRTQKFLNCSYSGEYNNSYIPPLFIKKNILFAGKMMVRHRFVEDCEHRKFHFQAIRENNARIRISPLSVFVNEPKIKPRLQLF